MELLTSLWNVIVAVFSLLIVLLQTLIPWTPLIAWVAFWLFAVNWRQLYPVLAKGGMIAVLLIGLMAVLVWSMIAPDPAEHVLFGLHVSNAVGKIVYVTGLIVIAFLCGSVQLTGCCGNLYRFEEPQPAPAEHHH